jgi:hypothetical protein
MGWADAPLVEESPPPSIPAWMQAPLVEEETQPQAQAARQSIPPARQATSESAPQPAAAKEPPAQPPPKQYEFEGTVYEFSPNRSRESIQRYFDKLTADRRTLNPEQAGGRAQWIDSDKSAKLRQRYPLGQTGLEEYAKLMSGTDAEGNEITVQPEDVTPQSLREYIKRRRAAAERAGKGGWKMPLALREFNEDTLAMERDLDRIWSNETTLEYKQRRAIARGDDPSKEEPTPSASVRDEAVRWKRIVDSTDPEQLKGMVTVAETLSRTPPLGIGEHAVASKLKPEDRALFQEVLRHQYAMDQTMGKAGYGARLATSAVQGAIDYGMPLAKMTGVAPKLNAGQERFKQELLAIREQKDPVVRPDTNVLGRGMQDAARMTFPMVQSVGAGKALGAAGTAMSAGPRLAKALTALGVSGSFLPQIADQTYTSLIGEGVEPSTAWKITAVSAPIEAAVESILPDPFTGYASAAKGTARQVAGKLLRQYTVNFTKELGEEGIQGVVNETAMEVGRRLDEEIPDKGLGNILARGISEMQKAAIPLALMIAPGAAMEGTQVIRESAARAQRLEQLRTIRSKGWVTVEEGKELGFSKEELTNRETRKAAVDERIQQTEQEIQDAERTARQAEEAGPEEGAQGEAGERLRLRDVEQIREEGKEEEIAPPVSEAEAPVAPEPLPEATQPEQAMEPVPSPETQPQAAQEPESPNYADMTVKELTSRARDLGLKGYSGKRKAALVGMLEEYGKQAEEQQPTAQLETARPAAQKGVRGGPGATVPTSTKPRGEKAPSTGEVVSSLSEDFGVPIRKGHFKGGPQKRGIYKELEKVARIKGYGDIAVASHEIAHHVDNTTNLLENLPEPLQSELAALDYSPNRGDIHEGFAEYVRHRLTDDDAGTIAPEFDAWFSNWLGTNPQMESAFQSARSTVDRWRGAGAVERVKAQIHMGESVWKRIGRTANPKTVWDWFANNWINRLRPLLKSAKEMIGTRTNIELRRTMPAMLNYWAIAKVSNIAAASKARGWAISGTTDAAGNVVGPGLKETFAPIASELQDSDALLDFYAYAYARHASTLYELHDKEMADWKASGQAGPTPRLKQPGISRADALATIEEFDSKPGWRKAAEGLTSWHNDLIDYLVDAGGLSQDAAETMKAMYPNYIALARNMDSEFASQGGGGGGRYANLPKGVRRLKGSGRQILPPLESALAYAERIIGLSDKIRVSKALVEASKQYGTLGDTVELVDPKDVARTTRLGNIKQQLENAGADLESADMDALLTVFSQEFSGEAKDNIVVLYEDGQPQLYYVRPDLYRSLMAVDKPARLPAIIDQTFGRAARMIRLGTTGLKAGFSLLTNPLRDIQTAMLQTEYQPRNPFSIAVNAAQGLVEDLTGSEVAQWWERTGGPMAQPLGIDRKFLKETVQELLAQSPKAKALNWAKHPIDSLRSLFSTPEAAPRLGEVRAALYELGWRPGEKVTFEQYIEAQLAGSDVSVDFREGGFLAMWTNQIVPFFNASIQGPHRMASAIRNHPVATIGAATMWMTIPSLLLWWRQKDEEWYRNLSAMERYRYWHYRISGTEVVIRIPKPFEWGHLFASMPEGAAQSMEDGDPEAFNESVGVMLEDMTPSAIPGLAEPPLEVASNKDFYFDRPLVSQRLKSLEPRDQYAPYTTETAKLIGDILNVSPIYVEHLASGWTGGLATDAARNIEAAIGLGGNKTQRSITGGLSTLPVVGRLFTSPLHTRQFDDFYNRLEKLEQKHESLKLRDQSDPSITMLKFMQDRARDLSELRSESRDILMNDSLTDEQKKERFVAIHEQMLRLAEEANQMSHLDRPSVSQDIRKKWKSIHKEMSGAVLFTAAKAPPDPDKFKGREEELRKAKKKYAETRELAKQRALAVAQTHTQAQQLLVEYYRRPGRKDANEFVGKTRKIQQGYIDKGIALAKLYGQSDPEKAFREWYRAWVKKNPPPSAK